MNSSEFARSDLDSGPHQGSLWAPRSDSPTTISRPARFVGGPTGWHAPALLLILFVFFPLVVVDSIWSADIGARLYQANALLTNDQWQVAHPLPRADPEGIRFPLHLSSRTDGPFQYIPLPKHPVLVWLTAASLRIGGGRPDNGLAVVVVVQTLSTFAAAMGTARLIARSRPRLAVPALWFTGLISPLFFDAYLGYAHSLAAALLVWGSVLALQFTDPQPSGASSDGSRLTMAVVLVAMACLLRTEATLLGVAAAAGLLVAGWERVDRGRWLFASGAVGLTTAAATVVDRLLVPATTGLTDPQQAVGTWGGLAGRVQGMQQTLLSPGRNDADILVLTVAALVIAGSYLAGRRGHGKPIPEIVLFVATIAAVLRVAAGGQILIFGLFMACPLLLVGLVRGLAPSWSRPETRFCLTTFVLFFAAVIATQYRFGGVAEWGGRYFAVGLPYAIVLAILGFDQSLQHLPAKRVMRLAALAVAPTLILNLGGLNSLRETRIATAAMVDEVAEAMATIRVRGDAGVEGSVVANVAPGDDRRPVVITTVPAVGRLSWYEVDNGRWLLVADDDMTSTARILSEIGVRRFVLVSFDVDRELAEIERFYRPEPWERTDDVPGDILIVSHVDQ